MSPISTVSQETKTVDGETVVVNTTKPGEFVVCNLASLSLGNIDVENQEELRSIIHTTVRALDNVIDLNFYPLPYAKLTNQTYRSIGLGIVVITICWQNIKSNGNLMRIWNLWTAYLKISITMLLKQVHR